MILRRLICATPAAAILLISAGCAQSAPQKLTATPGTLPAILAAAGDGDTVVLAKGQYSNLALKNRTYATPLTIDARAATIFGFRTTNVDGLKVIGGEFRLPPPTVNAKNGKIGYHQAVRLDRSRNVTLTAATLKGTATVPGAPADAYGEGIGTLIYQSENVEVSDSQFSGLKTGISVGRTEGFRFLRNTFSFQRSDGINIGESRKGLIEGNECRDTRRRDTEHADCIQLFSRPTSPPTADIVLRKNRVTGMTQGIGIFNHTRDGVDDGGFDRIVIEENDIHVGFPNGIGLTDARDSIVRNNRIRTYPGAEYRASIAIRGRGSVQRCGNEVAPGVGKSGDKDPPCPSR